MDALTTPSNWQKVRLGDIAEINPPTIIPNVFYYIDLESVEKGQLLNKQLMIKNKAPSRARRLLSKNDILYQLVRPYQRNNYFFTLNGNYVASTGYAQIRTLQNPSFLYFALHSNYFVNAVLDRCEGTSYPAISSNELKKCEVILPPLNEQIAIANILSDLDRYLYSLDALILKKESVKKALSFELLSQRKRLKGFNQAWQRVRLGDIANYLTSNLSAEQITQQGKIKVYDVNNFIGYTDTTFISDKPYISIVKDGSVGRVRILPPKTNILSTMGALIANHKTTTEFLFYLLSNFDFKNFTSGSIIPHIYFKDYKEKTIFLPPLNEQAAIANILSGLDSEIISLKNKKRQFENIKKALNHDLMSAKIRVLKK
ncbi:restriction endonuclease subunit S [Helicobacter pylori]|uniref:restriction endonuclease subunit S n=1 Tax=Helicobacter pylori TaxID=210 RepID=UPI000EB145CA|nr:restriction endonuclease subunit S [Helicobacter pylori]